jgi:hypothetical protein
VSPSASTTRRRPPSGTVTRAESVASIGGLDRGIPSRREVPGRHHACEGAAVVVDLEAVLDAARELDALSLVRRVPGDCPAVSQHQVQAEQRSEAERDDDERRLPRARIVAGARVGSGHRWRASDEAVGGVIHAALAAIQAPSCGGRVQRDVGRARVRTGAPRGAWIEEDQDEVQHAERAEHRGRAASDPMRGPRTICGSETAPSRP